MEDAIILGNGKVYKRSAFGGIEFHTKGWVNNLYLII